MTVRNTTFIRFNAILALLFFSIGLQAQMNIFEATRAGDTEAILKMIDADKDTVNAVNEHGHSPLILAAYNQQLEAMQLLIKNGADVNFTFSQGSAIHGAAFKGYAKVIAVLLENGADFDKPDQNGTTPLIYATLFKHQEVATMLYKKGADIKHKDNTGNSALDYATSLNNQELLTLFKSPLSE